MAVPTVIITEKKKAAPAFFVSRDISARRKKGVAS